MKQICTVLIVFLVALGSSFAQSTYDSSFSAVQKAGEEVMIKGEVVSTYYNGIKNGGLVFINLDAEYPKNPITIIIPKDARQNFPLMTEIEGKEVVIKGFLKPNKNGGKPTLFLEKKSQLSISSTSSVAMK